MTSNCTSSVACNEGLLGPSLAEVCMTSTFVVFMSILDTWIRNKEEISGVCDRVRSVETPDEEYDFVVIGGGAGGSVVAARLSEISHWKVLLLEAGPDEPVGSQIPNFAIQFLNSKNIWNYTTTNESNACLSTNGSCAWPSGKNLGGNTVHNSLIYLRGNPLDYSNWNELGNEGWTWEEVEPFFIKGENNGEIERVGREYHGTNGPLSVERFPHIPYFGNSILDAIEEAGYTVSEDLNGDKKTGFSIIQATNKNGVRQSSAAAYLRPVRNRENLHVSLNSIATRLIIEDDKAVGVEYYKDGKLKTVSVTREVIVSGGAMGSPHILLLSGIGPKEQLESVDIKVVKDLPGVGENLHDHPCAAISFTIDDPDTYDNNWAVAKEYLTSQTGPMASNGLTQILGLVPSNGTTSDYPDLEIYFRGYIAVCAPGEIDALQSTGKRTVIIGPSYLRPKSRGRITLTSNDPFELPLIWANYLGEPEDLERMIEGVKIILKFVNTETFRRYNFTLTPLEACTDYKFLSDEYWACVIQHSPFIVYHQAGTCKMGPSSDPMAVVDHRLRVHGIKGLRVADTSIMPEVISGNTAAPTMMIGERAVEFIKEDYGLGGFTKGLNKHYEENTKYDTRYKKRCN